MDNPIVEVTEHDGSVWLSISRDHLAARLKEVSNETLLRLWDLEVMSRPSGSSLPWTAVGFARSVLIKAISDALGVPK